MTATRMINELKGVNRVVHDMTTKPPGGSRARHRPEATCPASPQPMASGSERHRGRPGGGPERSTLRFKVTLTDGATAGFYQFGMSFLGTTATRIINEVKASIGWCMT